jgi:hypothetical protein
MLINDNGQLFNTNKSPFKLINELYIFKFKNNEKTNIFKKNYHDTLLYFTSEPNKDICSCKLLTGIIDCENNNKNYIINEFHKKYIDVLSNFIIYIVSTKKCNISFGLEWYGINNIIKISLYNFLKNILLKNKIKQDIEYQIFKEESSKIFLV